MLIVGNLQKTLRNQRSFVIITFFPVYSYTAFFKDLQKLENLRRYSVLTKLSRKKSENKMKHVPKMGRKFFRTRRRNPP